MTNLMAHALTELRIAGYFDSGNDLDIERNEAMVTAVLKLIELFSKQGHSGGSAMECLEIFSCLARQKPLTPLTGKDYEWNEIADSDLKQNSRASNVFKDKTGRCYDIEGKVFIGHDGISFTTSESVVDITFPYELTTKKVQLDKSGALINTLLR